ncbi:uncharacterized protein LOC119566301 isoform X3 [Chelonia mydas]|uniref:uncharacterized protein LOC119566301 isoform X3 n=1 Tax=Chelonia mydas TaxID=8469 RepID=UPI001CA943C7|nr:uncharacterized protein LOC119566301 isoform X3 [Chelonia mydas]
MAARVTKSQRVTAQCPDNRARADSGALDLTPCSASARSPSSSAPCTLQGLAGQPRPAQGPTVPSNPPNTNQPLPSWGWTFPHSLFLHWTLPPWRARSCLYLPTGAFSPGGCSMGLLASYRLRYSGEEPRAAPKLSNPRQGQGSSHSPFCSTLPASIGPGPSPLELSFSWASPPPGAARAGGAARPPGAGAEDPAVDAARGSPAGHGAGGLELLLLWEEAWAGAGVDLDPPTLEISVGRSQRTRQRDWRGRPCCAAREGDPSEHGPWSCLCIAPRSHRGPPAELLMGPSLRLSVLPPQRGLSSIPAPQDLGVNKSCPSPFLCGRHKTPLYLPLALSCKPSDSAPQGLAPAPHS